MPSVSRFMKPLSQSAQKFCLGSLYHDCPGLSTGSANHAAPGASGRNVELGEAEHTVQGGPARVGDHACCLCPGLPPEHRELSVDTLQYCFCPDLHQPGPHGSHQFLPGPPSTLPCLHSSQVEAVPGLLLPGQCSSQGITRIFQAQ